MKPVDLNEIVSLDRYAGLRKSYRDAVVRHKRDRRISIGDKVTLVFEDRETLRFQVQEMCWIERISAPDRVQAEIDVYNELLPGANELSATLFIEITDSPSIRTELESIAGTAVASQVRVLYGGSVKPGNVKELLCQPNIDGALVGGASLDADNFLKLCRWQEQ